MADIAVKVKNISKRYRIGLRENLPDTFIGSLSGWVKSPFSNFRRLQKLSHFSDENDTDDIIWAVKNISFEVRKGEVLGIIGKNGAGKSTLLKILCRITEPTSGKASMFGRVASLLEVGTGFHPELTGRENVFLNGTFLGMSKYEINQKFDEIVDFSGVEKFIDTPVKRYSSGMRVRLAFAVAAHLEPEILLIDEVLAVGDVEFQNKCLGKMKDVTEAGRTILFVSHNMEAVKSLCSRSIYIDKGKIKNIGNTIEIVNNYLGIHEITSRTAIINKDQIEELKHEELFQHEKYFEIDEISVCDHKNQLRLDYFSNEKILINVKFDCFYKIKNFRLAVNLFSGNGDLLMSSTFTDDSHMLKFTTLEPGHYNWQCELPENILGSNDFVIGVYLMNPYIHHLSVRSCFKINSKFKGHNGIIRLVNAPAAFKPKLKWTEI